MTDLLERIKDLEAKYRKPPEAPRDWASAILKGTASIDQVPEHLRQIVQDHIDTAAMFSEQRTKKRLQQIEANAQRIYALPNGKARLAAFNEFKARHPDMAEAVRARVLELKGEKK